MIYEAFVYQWNNSINKIYIGAHKGNINDGYISSSKSDLFWKDWANNQIEWNRTILFVGSVKEAFDFEKNLLDQYKKEILTDSSFYNNSVSRGILFTEEVRNKISKRKKGRPSGISGYKFPKFCCIDCKREISLNMIEIHKCKIKTDKKRKRTVSIETKEKISKSLKGKKKTEETKKKMSVSFSKRILSEETKKKIGLAASKNTKNTIWITDGTSNKRVKYNEEIPINWYKGRKI